MSPILFFIIFFICTGVGKIFLQINSAAVAFINILIAAWEGLTSWGFQGRWFIKEISFSTPPNYLICETIFKSSKIQHQKYQQLLSAENWVFSDAQACRSNDLDWAAL